MQTESMSYSKTIPKKEQTILKNYSKYHRYHPNLTRRELEVFLCISEEYLTSKQISSRLGISVRRVDHIKTSLKKKDYLSSTGNVCSQKQTPVSINILDMTRSEKN